MLHRPAAAARVPDTIRTVVHHDNPRSREIFLRRGFTPSEYDNTGDPYFRDRVWETLTLNRGSSHSSTNAFVEATVPSGSHAARM